jgi:parallel beta-helix repeat protein
MHTTFLRSRSGGRRLHTSAALVVAACLTLGAASAAQAAQTYYVAPTGSDGNACSAALPCRQIRRALTLVVAGDTIMVADGSYLGFDVNNRHGLSGQPIVIKAAGTGAQVVKTTDRSDDRDTIFVTSSSHVVIDGLRSFQANRAAVRIDDSDFITVRNGVFGNNTTWGIFTDFSDDLLLENNECYGSGLEHGIYVSNSGDRPVVRGNRVHDNIGSGIQLNADESAGGDGIITGAVIESNVIYNNGVVGGAAINLDGVQDSTVRNNLLYNNHATGIVNYQGDGAQGPRGMKIFHNTVDVASDGRYALLIWNSTGANQVRNNILYNRNAARGGINYGDATDVANTDSDYNIMDRLTPNDGDTVLTLAQWQAQGHELHSLSAIPAAMWVNAGAADYHLAAGSPAIDRGQTLASVTTDFDGHSRPSGLTSDIGAYEFDSVRLADFNGDLRADILARKDTGQVQVLASTGTAFSASQWTSGFVSYRYDVYQADVTGDGRADLVARSKDNGNVEVFRSTGSGFTYAAGSGPGGVWSYGWGTSYDLYFADVTGDGRADLVGRYNANGDVIVFPSTGAGFSSAPPAGLWTYGWSAGYDLFFGDATGDGKADILARYFGPNAGITGNIYVGSSTGTSFASPGTWTYGYSAGYDIAVADANGDGKADLVTRYFGPTAGLTGDVYVMYSTGTGFSWNGNFGRWTYGWGSTYDFLVRDATGDGKADFVGRHRGNGEVYVVPSTGTAFTGLGVWGTGMDATYDIR